MDPDGVLEAVITWTMLAVLIGIGIGLGSWLF